MNYIGMVSDWKKMSSSDDDSDSYHSADEDVVDEHKAATNTNTPLQHVNELNTEVQEAASRTQRPTTLSTASERSERETAKATGWDNDWNMSDEELNVDDDVDADDLVTPCDELPTQHINQQVCLALM